MPNQWLKWRVEQNRRRLLMLRTPFSINVDEGVVWLLALLASVVTGTLFGKMTRLETVHLQIVVSNRHHLVSR